MDQMNNAYYGGAPVNPYFTAPQPQPSMGWGYVPQVPNPGMKTPNFNNALTNEEISILRNNKPADSFNINISQEDNLRAICTHKNGQDNTVFQMNDGSNDVWCSICGARWNPETKSKEEVEALVKELLDTMQSSKWFGDLPVQLVRDYYVMMPLIKKFPEIYEVALNNFNKYSGQDASFNAQDYSVYGQYNMLMNNGMFYGSMPQPGQAYGYGYGYPNQPAQQPAPQQGYYFQGNQQPGVAANPYVNPMQAPMGYNPAAPNQQFVQQAQNMMPQQPVYGTPAPQPQPYQPAQQPAAQPEVKTATTEATIDV